MLQMRPNCECCDLDLAPESSMAWICSLECTFCDGCVETKLKGRCPNCGGQLARRPTRAGRALAKYPASSERVFKPAGCAASETR